MDAAAARILAGLDERLLPWFERVRRDLPWRRTRDPYAVWVSEIMLQQTRVETVIPYYEAFIEKFPTVRALADAPLEDVLKAWEGLGYYARARNLHRAACRLAEDEAPVPDTLSLLLKLPGVGRYSAGAILSIAYGKAVPALDGNVRRVLARLFADGGDPRSPHFMRRLWDHAEALIGRSPEGKAAAHNEALMELGATVCTPLAPACPECPVQALCVARKQGEPEAYPASSGRKRVPHYDLAAAVVRDMEGRILIRRRHERGLLGGLWEMPAGRVLEGEPLEATCRREVEASTGVRIRVDAPLGEVKHAFTHFKITLHAFLCTPVGGEAQPLQCDAVAWIAPDETKKKAFSAANHRILAALRARMADSDWASPQAACSGPRGQSPTAAGDDG